MVQQSGRRSINSVRKYWSQVQSVRSVTFLSKIHFCRDTTINLIIFTALALFYKDNYNSAPSQDIFTIFSALQTLERDLSFGIIHWFLQN